MMYRSFFVLVLFALVFFIFPKQTLAATIYANYSTGNDSTGDGSSGSPYKTFHKAYTMASANDTIDLTGTFDWSNADETGDTSTSGYTLTKSLTIVGQTTDTTFIQASSTTNTADRRIFTALTAGTSLTLRNLTLRYGRTSGSLAVATAIQAQNVNLTMINTILTSNISSATYTNGGPAIYHSGNSYTFIMRNSEVSYNGDVTAYYGYTGAFDLNSTHASNEITNTTFFANGGAYNGSIYLKGKITITNSTFIGNRGNVSCTDIHTWASGAVAYLKNSIFAQKASGGQSSLCVGAGGGSFSDGGNNIIETQSSAGFTNGVNGNLVGTQSSLNIASSLSTNTATTGVKTLTLSSGSVAINAGTTTVNNGIAIPATDARQFIRDATPDIGAYEFGATVSDTTTPVISSIATSTASTTATITWTTDEIASSKIVYGATSVYGTTTVETDTSPRVTSHSVTILNLIPCTKYFYQAYSADAASNVATSSQSEFRTVGCTGNSTVATSTVSTVTTVSGGSLTQDRLTLTVPTLFTTATSSAFFQTSQLDATNFFTAAGLPSGKSRAGDTVFNIKALTDTGSVLSSFDSFVTVSLVYTDQDVVGLDESTLKIYRYDGASWYALSNCTVDTLQKTVTCSTTAFSDFAIFGEPVASSTSVSNVGVNAGASIIYGCRDESAFNYSNFVAHDQNMCVFSNINSSTTTNDLIAKNSLQTELVMQKLVSTFIRNLHLGIRGDDVRRLQEHMIQKGFNIPAGATGFFGVQTKQALISYQKTSQIFPAIGFFGPITREKISIGY